MSLAVARSHQSGFVDSLCQYSSDQMSEAASGALDEFEAAASQDQKPFPDNSLISVLFGRNIPNFLDDFDESSASKIPRDNN
jgi:hypothetical protein